MSSHVCHESKPQTPPVRREKNGGKKKGSSQLMYLWKELQPEMKKGNFLLLRRGQLGHGTRNPSKTFEACFIWLGIEGVDFYFEIHCERM